MTEGAALAVSREILGHVDDERFAGRRVERVVVPAARASRRRLRERTDAGTDVAADLPAGSYLRHGAVLLDDGERIVVVHRPPEEAAIVRFSAQEDERSRVAQAVLLGHALGNMHAPLEVVDGEIRIPVTTSRSVLTRTIEALQLHGVELRFADVALACDEPLAGPSSGHHHG